MNYLKILVLIFISAISSSTIARSFDLNIEEVEKNAASGDAYAQFLMGYTREAKDSPVHHYKEAISWYTKSSEQGFSPSTYSLAALYFNGISIKQDKQKGFQLYKKAAESGYPPAIYVLGVFYDKGDMVEVNYDKSSQYFIEAASKGDTMAQVNLGVYYVKGLAVKQDFTEAYAWFSVAAKKGNSTSIKYKVKIAKMMSSELLKIAKIKALDYENRYFLSDSDFERTYIKVK